MSGEKIMDKTRPGEKVYCHSCLWYLINDRWDHPSDNKICYCEKTAVEIPGYDTPIRYIYPTTKYLPCNEINKNNDCPNYLLVGNDTPKNPKPWWKFW